MTTPNYPRPLSSLLPGMTKDMLGAKNMLFGKLLAAWAHIAGEDIARQTRPIQLKSARPRKGKTAKAILHLAIDPAFALDFTYQKPLLIERLNLFFGYSAVMDIKTVQNYGLKYETKVSPSLIPPTLSLAEQQDIEDSVRPIKENDLQMALKNLGKAITQKTKIKTATKEKR